ncbi:MAG: peptidase [Planctomycetota bacterium]
MKQHATGQLMSLAAALSLLVLGSSAHGQTIRLRDGRLLEGKVLALSGVAEPPVPTTSDKDGPPRSTPIVVVDDELRRTFIPKLTYVEVVDQVPKKLVRIRLKHQVAGSGQEVVVVGPSLGITPFDNYGRRTYHMQLGDGPLAVVQGITLLTPTYCRVEGLQGPKRQVVWDSRIATSSIPIDTLLDILRTAVDQTNLESRLQIVRFFLQAERYSDARRELQRIIAEFPEQEELTQQVAQLQRLGADRILREVDLRREAGQHAWVRAVAQNFPTAKVSGPTLEKVREILQRYQRDDARIDGVRGQIETIAGKITDADHRKIAEPVLQEVLAGLSHNTVGRLIAFSQLAGDESLTPEQRAALAITGWLLGPDLAEENLAAAVSLAEVRNAVREYLREPQPLERDKLLASMISMEGATVPNVAALLANMLPPLDAPDDAERGPGCYELTAPGLTEDGNFRYLVQLPLEYDPHRRYPLIYAMNGGFNSPLQELNFWAGRPAKLANDREGPGEPGPRNGAAMRHGYITIAVEWQKPQQLAYEYSAREHAAALTCLRDAFRRFSIDTDRVYLTGHGTGGELAWDVGQAHPDLWAGVIPFVALGRKYIPHYWDNARHLPLYFVAGELDGRKMSQNAAVFDSYLKRLSNPYDCTVVEFLGRGQEPFHDELPRLFDWMGRKQRGDAPQEFRCSTLRPWDNFFWWVECRELPPRLMRHPADNWDKRSIKTAEIEAKVLSPNRLRVRTPSEQTVVWLRPGLVDFDKEIRVDVNRKKVTSRRGGLKPDLSVLLEDARTRADRQRPYWAKLTVP